MTQFYDDSWKEMPCEIWPKTLSQDGYGLVALPSGKSGGVYDFAHRYTWEQCFGPVPDGLKVLHKCDVPACRQPFHLWLGTNADNSRDMVLKGRGRGRYSGKTHCAAGHDLSVPGAVYVRPNGGGRTCQLCHRERSREWWRRTHGGR